MKPETPASGAIERNSGPEEPLGSGDAASAASRGNDRKPRIKFGSAIAAITAVIAAIAGIVALLFQIDPGLAPCLGSREAHFTGAPVFPNYPFKQFLADIGHATVGYKNLAGAEVRYTYEASDLRGELLVLRATLVKIGRDGGIVATFTNATAYANQLPEAQDTPARCSQSVGSALWVLVPPEARGRLRIILELFAGTGRQDRVALGATPIFHG
jgi:hypothetical protein